MKKMTICDYLARTVPQEAYEVLEESGYGFDRPKNTVELSMLLKKYIALERESGLKKLAAIHPDKDLLQSLDRQVMESDYDYNPKQDSSMLVDNYQNPFWKTPFRVGAPNMMAANGCGGYSNFCPSCGSSSFNGMRSAYMNCDGDCGCGGKCGGNKMNADGGGNGKKDYTPLYVAIGIFALALYFAEVNRKS
jgi:hypothetical protein